MGCEYCKYTDYGEHDCTAPLRYRKGFCEVYFPGEQRPRFGNSNYTPPKKKRKKVKRH